MNFPLNAHWIFSAFFLSSPQQSGVFSSLQHPRQLAPLLSTCINREGQSLDFIKTWKGNMNFKGNTKMARIGFPSLRPRLQHPTERTAATGILRDSTTLLPPLCLGQKREAEPARVFPMTLISCVMVITTATLLTAPVPGGGARQAPVTVAWQKHLPSAQPLSFFLHRFGARASGSANETGSACWKRT